MAQLRRKLRVIFSPKDGPKDDTHHFNGIGFFWDDEVAAGRVTVVTDTAEVESVIQAYRDLGVHIRIALRDRTEGYGKRLIIKKRMLRGLKQLQWLAQHERCMKVWLRWYNWCNARHSKKKEQGDGTA